MKPLSAIKYIRNNKKKVIPICLSVCFGVFLIYFLSMIIGEVVTTVRSSDLKLENYSVIMPAEGSEIPQSIIDSLKKNADIETLLPALNDMYGLHKTMIISSLGTSVLFLKDNDIDKLMNKVQAKLIEGRKPQAGKYEIMIHEQLARNKGLKIGDKVGSEIDEIDSLEGKYTITGIIDGPCLMSFASYPVAAGIDEDALYRYGIAAIPKPGKIKEINSFIEKLSSEEILRLTLDEVLPVMEERLNMSSSTIYLLEMLVIIVLCISLGNINHINFYQRRREFGVLSAMGHSKAKLYKKIWLEMALINFTGYLLGILLSLLVGWMLNEALWLPKGQYMPLWNMKNILVIMFLPAFVTIFSVLPAVRLLKKTDPILVIEGVA